MRSSAVRSRLLVSLFTVASGVPFSAAHAQASPSLPPWIGVDSAARTVTLTLEVVAGAAGASASIAGFDHGGVQVVVPLGWTVKWHWTNRDSVDRHSLVVMAEREKLPSEGGRPVFDNAMSRMESSGLKPGESDDSSFQVDQAGWYWMLCGVPGHALGGEWIGLRVDPAARLPGVVETRKT
jgi:uncharacterized cupredoxin-like copper-binding protein